MDYFNKLLDLLKIEQEEDLLSYRKLTETTSASERRANGLCWYPVAIRGTEIGRGDYLTVEIERTTHQDLPHQLRFGASAALFSNHDLKDRIEGVITHQNGNKLKIAVRIDELPDWARDGKLGVDVLFDQNSYDEMQHALKQADSIDGQGGTADLVKTLTGNRTPEFSIAHYQYLIPSLNVMQQLAVDKILSADHLAIVHGPPGTGKTTTLVQAVKALSKQDHQQILVAAPSNTAVDLLTEKLAEQGLNVLRIGNPSRVSERLMSLTLDSRMAEHPEMKQAKALKKQANEYKNMAHKYKRNFGKAEKEQRKALFDEAHKIMKEVGNIEQYVSDDIISKADVIAATLVGANHHTIRKLKYKTVIIDEAGQALEPACWIPIIKSEKVIFAGDHCQLSPTIKSNEAAKKGLSNTLMEKMVNQYPESVVLLEEQYRMNRSIMEYSSEVFYQGKLKAHDSVATHLLYDDDKPLLFIDTAGASFEEKTEGHSISNPDEASFVSKQLETLVQELSLRYSIEDFPTVAIISPYKQQIVHIKELLQHSPDIDKFKSKISVNTIDSFQGQERDVVVISMVRSNDEGIIGFLADIRRMNVAMTRARKKLIVIGDSATLCRLPFYENFIAYAQKLDAYQSVWEFINL
ncbi:DNA helicase [Pedobacter sp. BAL39]|uniref:AAA domain-containing protein n=1 Tax=Pedobacter sp. BAL39 TaxID=391596 RepID=UPI0001559293|nr:AAA domain-containing protein [Pedobacter sp. BAL39]EDM38461.1 DNA helicase [Pedobacter sp. BAL39]